MIEITLEVHHETDEAYLVSDGGEREWIPKSQVKVLAEIDVDYVEVEMPEWLAKEKGFI